MNLYDFGTCHLFYWMLFVTCDTSGYWDTRKGSQPVEVTPVEKSHRDPIFDVKFIQSKTGWSKI